MYIRIIGGYALYLICLASVAAQQVPLLVARPDAEHEYPSGRSIPNGATARTGKQSCTMLPSWLERVFVAPCRQANPQNAALIDYVTKGCRYLGGTGEEFEPQLNARAGEIQRSGVRDAAFSFFAGLVSHDVVFRERYYREALSALPHSGYAPFVQFIAASCLAKSLADRHASAVEQQAADETALDALRRGLTADSFRADEMIVLRRRLASPAVDSLMKRRASDVVEILSSATGVPEWVREFGQGEAFRVAAWEGRTDGWAPDVSDQGWATWKDNLRASGEHFTRSWELNRDDPAAAACMIEVAMGNGDKQAAREWFDRSVAAEMDYYDAYRAFVWALRPRWLGSHAEMLQFGEECLRTARFDTCVPNYYFKVVSDIASEEEDNPRRIYDDPAVNEHLRRTLDSYFATPDMPVLASYTRTMAAILEFRRGNASAARTHLTVIGFHPSDRVGRGLAEDIPSLMHAIGTAPLPAR